MASNIILILEIHNILVHYILRYFLLYMQCFQRSVAGDVWLQINSLPNDKILDSSKLKAFEDDIIYVTQKLKFVLRRVENIVGNGENAGYQYFLLFPQFLKKVFFSRS